MVYVIPGRPGFLGMKTAVPVFPGMKKRPGMHSLVVAVSDVGGRAASETLKDRDGQVSDAAVVTWHSVADWPYIRGLSGGKWPSLR